MAQINSIEIVHWEGSHFGLAVALDDGRIEMFPIDIAPPDSMSARVLGPAPAALTAERVA